MRPCSALLWLLLLTSSTAPADPTWWEARGVKSTAPAANLAPATIGQAKHTAAMALVELQGHMSATAYQALYDDLADIVDLTLPNPLPSDFYEQQRAVLLTGQLKAIAKPFYDHLRTHGAAWLDNAMTAGNLIVMEPGSNPPTPSPYPWSEAATDDANRAPATLGQLKAVFSLSLETLPGIPTTPPADTDGDGMPDEWEIQYGFDPNDPADANLNSDGDGFSNILEFQLGLSPSSVDVVGPLNFGFDEDLPNEGEEHGPIQSFRDEHPSDLYPEVGVPGWRAAIGNYIEVWDEGNGNPYVELQSHKGADGIKQTFEMIPGTRLTFILRYKGRYENGETSDNAFVLKVEDASELLVNGTPVEATGNSRSHSFMEYDLGNQWESWSHASVTITAPQSDSGLMPITLSLMPKTTTPNPDVITRGGFVDFSVVSIKDDLDASGVDNVSNTVNSNDKGYQDKFWIMAPSGEHSSNNPRSNEMYFDIPHSPVAKLRIFYPPGVQAPATPTPALVTLEQQMAACSWHGESALTTELPPVSWEIGNSAFPTYPVALPIGVKTMKQRTVNVKVWIVPGLKADGTVTQPTNIPTKQNLDEYLNDIFTPQLNCIFNCTVVNANPLRFDKANGTDFGAPEGEINPENGYLDTNNDGVAEANTIKENYYDTNSSINIYIVGGVQWIQLQSWVTSQNQLYTTYDLVGLTIVPDRTAFIVSSFAHSDIQKIKDTIAHEIGHVILGEGHPDKVTMKKENGIAIQENGGIAPLLGVDPVPRLMCSGDKRNEDGSSRLLVKTEWDKAEAWFVAEEIALRINP